MGPSSGDFQNQLGGISPSSLLFSLSLSFHCHLSYFLSASVITSPFLSLWHLCFPLIRTLSVTLMPPGKFPNLKILYVITSAKLFLVVLGFEFSTSHLSHAPQCFFALVIFQIVLHFCQGPLGPRTSTYAFSVLVITAFFVVVDMGNH
jgi:hypothetical protein